MIKLVFFAGSSRRDSLNKKLALAASVSTKSSEIETSFIDLSDYNIPIYCADDEASNGTPADVIKLKTQLGAADGIFISSPEYNGAYSGLLKNFIDWMSRNSEGTPTPPFKNSVVAISACSPGMRGGLTGLTSLRLVINHIGGNVIPTQAAIGAAKFNDEGSLSDENHQKMLNGVLEQFIKTAKALQ